MDIGKVWNEFKQWIIVSKNQRYVGIVLLCIAAMILLGWKTFLLIAATGGAYWMYNQYLKEQGNKPEPEKDKGDTDEGAAFAELLDQKTVDAMWKEFK